MHFRGLCRPPDAGFDDSARDRLREREQQHELRIVLDVPRPQRRPVAQSDRDALDEPVDTTESVCGPPACDTRRATSMAPCTQHQPRRPDMTQPLLAMALVSLAIWSEPWRPAKH